MAKERRFTQQELDVIEDALRARVREAEEQVRILSEMDDGSDLAKNRLITTFRDIAKDAETLLAAVEESEVR